VRVGASPYDVTFADGATWVTDYSDGTVSRVDAATNTRTVVKVGDTPVGIAHTPGAVWVPLPTSGDLARIDTTTLAVSTVKLAPGIGWTAYDDTSVWVANTTTGTVTRVDPATRTVVATVKVGPRPLDGDILDGVVWIPDKGGDLYPVDASTNTVGPPVRSTTGNPFVVAGWDHYLWTVDFSGTDVVAIDPRLARG
jgi:YVTN family beta-propeller protein